MAEITILNDYYEDEPPAVTTSQSSLLTGKLNKLGDLIKFKVQKTYKESGPTLFLDTQLKNLKNLESQAESRMSKIETRMSYNNSIIM